MLGRLITVSVIAHIRYLHLCDLMNAETIVGVIVNRRDYKDRVKHPGK